MELKNSRNRENGFARIRSIREVARYCREMDPDTQLTEYTIRKLIAGGTIPAVRTGSKYLVNLDQVLAMFCGTDASGSAVLS